MREIQILIVDDHSLFRESLGRLLDSNPEFRVVGQCANMAEALQVLARTRIDVILLDYDLGEESGFTLIKELKRFRSEARVLMVTAGMSDAMTLHIMEAGVDGIFLKHSNSDTLLAAIRKVVDGEIWLDAAAARSLVAGGRNREESSNRARPLSIRQNEVLRGILDGLTNKEIAWKLKVSESSVKAVIQELFYKAGVRTRSQLVRIAIERRTGEWLK